jgi:hypothetical protein
MIRNLEDCNDLQGLVVDDLIKLLKFKNYELDLQRTLYEREEDDETDEVREQMNELRETYQDIKNQEGLLKER